MRATEIPIGNSGQMAKLSRAIFMMGVFAVALLWNPIASARAQSAQTPQQALINLYQATEQLIKDPAADYGDGTYPYPSAMETQWDNSFYAHGSELSAEERGQFIPCAAHLKAAITDVEIGYRVQVTQPKNNTAAQQDGQTRRDEAPAKVALCDSAYKLAQSEIINSSANAPQQGQAAASSADGSVVAGSAAEAALPGSTDWTPALNDLFKYLSNQWQKVVTDPANRDWAADNAGNTLTLKLQPNQVPEVVSATGSRSSVFNNIMQGSEVPKTTFPAGSTLRSVLISPKFFVKPSLGTSRTRLKYYERDGIFKSYQSAQ